MRCTARNSYHVFVLCASPTVARPQPRREILILLSSSCICSPLPSYLPCTIHASTSLPICSSTTVARSARRKRSDRGLRPARSGAGCRLVEGAAERGAIPLVTWKSNAVLRSLYQDGHRRKHAAGRRARSGSHGAGAGVHRHSRRGQQQPIRRRAAANGWTSTSTIGGKRCTPRPRREDEMGRAALSDRLVRPGGHMSTARSRTSTSTFARPITPPWPRPRSRWSNGWRRPTACGSSRPAPTGVLDPGHSGGPLRGRPQHPRRRSLHRPGPRQHQRHIRFNTPSRYQGTVFDHIEFEFKNGKIVRATANDTEKINEVLDSDEGARYIGEWAIGVNNRVRDRCSTRCSTKKSAAAST